MTTSIRSSILLLALLACALPAGAQGPDAGTDPAADASEQLFASIQWQEGPDSARIGSESQIAVPENCRFTGAPGARNFLIATENPPSGNELGILVCAASEESDPWFVVFSFDDSGYVRDTDAGDLDADAILASLRESNVEGNKERSARGWSPLILAGWVRAPHYDPQTHNLTWATKVQAPGEDPSVNHSVRLLGRGGVMNADLVTSPEDFAANLPAFDEIVATHAFLPGRRYAEWREGDKLAGYGLTALVAGGAGAIAAKSGLLGKLFKVIVVAVVGALAWLRSLFSGKKRNEERVG
jgi:uncharacterized membrane-anchored protein